MTTPDNSHKQRRGFAAMSADKRVEIARKGGASVPRERRSFFQNQELAATAGRKGGKAPRLKDRRPDPDMD